MTSRCCGSSVSSAVIVLLHLPRPRNNVVADPSQVPHSVTLTLLTAPIQTRFIIIGVTASSSFTRPNQASSPFTAYLPSEQHTGAVNQGACWGCLTLDMSGGQDTTSWKPVTSTPTVYRGYTPISPSDARLALFPVSKGVCTLQPFPGPRTACSVGLVCLVECGKLFLSSGVFQRRFSLGRVYNSKL